MTSFFEFGKKREYNDFKNQISSKNWNLMDSVREFSLSLGKNVVEDVRMHRVVYCKSVSFRWFLDVEPQKESFVLKIQFDRKTPQKIIAIKNLEEFNTIKQEIIKAYNNLH